MNETDNSQTRVNDRRRFDPEGNPRPETEEAAAAPVPQVDAEVDVVPGGPTPAGEALLEPEDQEIRRLQSELESAHKRVDELARAYQAVVQDREDFKTRLTRERERMIDVEKGNVALGLVEAIDELDLCLRASDQDSSPLAKGVQLIRDNMLARLTAAGVERFDPVGQPFDPNLAEAADMEITADPAMDQQVTAELRAGYRLKGRVIRPARVKVAKYIEPARA
jgi:molecular chaperone GrpE